ncbi:MAG: hypothetical protein GXP32_09880, partial [Kiritimatiellaeota bacterium]|nr:hypothetical protein [Kiritimatiellota bacterium]
VGKISLLDVSPDSELSRPQSLSQLVAQAEKRGKRLETVLFFVKVDIMK